MINILITLCARGGSKGLFKKNIKPLCGKPLIEYSINTAMAFIKSTSNRCDLALSSDDDEIIFLANKLGLKTKYKRPDHLAIDSAGKVETIADLLAYEENIRNIRYDYILDLDVSSPLRSVEDINNAFKVISNDTKAINLFSVSKAHRNPYFNMVEMNTEGYYNLIKQLPQNVLSRQVAPKVYDLNASFYYYRRSFFEEGFNTVFTKRSLIYEIQHICFDIDSLLDFEIMEFLIENKKLDFDI